VATDIVMPNLGFDTQSAIIVEWYKQPGDTVSKGEVIALIEADKSNVELESIAGGVLLEIRVSIDEEVDVGTVIAQIGEASEAEATSVRISPVAQRVASEKGVNLDTVAGSGTHGRIMRRDIEEHVQNDDSIPMALPKVRKAAREAGINLHDLGILGRPVTLADLEAHTRPTIEQQPEFLPVREEAAPVEPVIQTQNANQVPPSRIRQRIGKRLVKSKQEAPHFYVTGEFDLTDAITQLSNYQAGINDLLQYLTVQVLLQVPELNCHFDGNFVYNYEHVNLAFAVALDDGLVTPVITNADRYALNGLAQLSRELIKRTRDGKLKPEDMQQGTFTISNLGVIKQVDHFTAIINPPQVGILAVGTVKQRPVVINGGFHARDMVHLTLSGDHRVVDGMHLARFMAAFQEELDRFTR